MIKNDFKRVYSEKLNDYGYNYYPRINYYVKVINDELISFIGYKIGMAKYMWERSFTPVGGCVSLYFTSLKKDGIRMNEHDLFTYYRKKHNSSKYSECEFIYAKDDATGIEVNMRNKFAMVIESIIPVLEMVKDLDTYIEYKMLYGNLLFLCEEFRWDSLVLIKADNHDDFMSYYDFALNRSQKEFEKGLHDERFYTIEDEKRSLYKSIIVDTAQSRDKVYSDPELYRKALEEADRRKKANTELLRSYGLEI